MAHSKLSLANRTGQVRATDSAGNYCVTRQDFTDVGWCADTSRYCHFTGMVARVTIVAPSLVWEDAPAADPFEINDY